MDGFIPTRREDWTEAKAEAIAAKYGYCLNGNFINALNGMIGVVNEASTTANLNPVADSYFRRWQPPLDKIPRTPSAPPVESPTPTPDTTMPQRGNIFTRWFRRG